MHWIAPADALRTARTCARRLRAQVRAARAALVTARHEAFPVEDGRLAVDGIEGRVEVLRDHYGVPHVFAGSERDALYGQGFVHAQDRLFQMDLLRRAGAGRISEWAGRSALEADRFLRRLGFADIAARDFAHCPPEGRALLQAYAAGVNAAIEAQPALPPEYAFLGATPEPWHPEHTLLLARFVLFTFASNWDTELQRERLLRALGRERAAAVEPTTALGTHTATGGPVAAAERVLHAYAAAVAQGMPSGAASNAWAVTAERTTTGAPLLASDPHLESRMPGLLHVSHVVGGAFDVIGANVPGVPLVAMGHNRDLAWGITAGLADVSDCVFETIDPQNPTRYRAPDGWRSGRTRIERIEVRDGEPVEERVLETRFGPVIGPALPGEARAVALHSAALTPGDPLTPLLDLARARTIEAFDAAVARRPGPTFNYVFASRDEAGEGGGRAGRIGYRMSGSIPQRAHGEGLLPCDGASASDPAPDLPPAAMPHRLDPPEDMLVSANQAPGLDPAHPYELGEDWCEGDRAARIVTLLAARERHDVASFTAMQTDRHSVALLRLRTLLTAAGLPADPALRAQLRAWDGAVEADSAVAAVLETVLREAARALATRAAGREANVLLGAVVLPGLTVSAFAYRAQGWVLDALEAAAAPWCDGPGDRDRLLSAAVTRALDSLHHRLGAEPANWRWGDLHVWRLPHPLASVPGVGRWFSRGPYPFPGDVNTVQQGSLPHLSASGTISILPGYRQVLDLADFDRSRFMLSTGNSGIPGHPRYDDCIPDFLAGRLRPLLYSRQAIEAHVAHALLLEPA